MFFGLAPYNIYPKACNNSCKIIYPNMAGKIKNNILLSSNKSKQLIVKLGLITYVIANIATRIIIAKTFNFNKLILKT